MNGSAAVLSFLFFFMTGGLRAQHPIFTFGGNHNMSLVLASGFRKNMNFKIVLLRMRGSNLKFQNFILKYGPYVSTYYLEKLIFSQMFTEHKTDG